MTTVDGTASTKNLVPPARGGVIDGLVAVLHDGVRGMRREPGAVLVYVALAMVVGVWAAKTPRLTPGLLALNLTGMVPLVMAAVGMSIVLIAKGIDLSMGSMVLLADMITLVWAKSLGSPWLGALAALVVVTGMGLLSGLAIGVLKLPALVVTLAMGSIAAGLALYVCPEPVSGTLPGWFTGILTVTLGPVPLILILAFAIPALVWFPIRRSRAGFALVAVGGDEASAFINGLKPWRSQALAYALSGLFAGFAGIMLAMATGGGTSSATTTYTLNAIASAVLGGVALTGGRGSILGAIGGAFMMSFIKQLLTIYQIGQYWQYVVSGGILVIVVGVPYLINQARARKAERA